MPTTVIHSVRSRQQAARCRADLAERIEREARAGCAGGTCGMPRLVERPGDGDRDEHGRRSATGSSCQSSNSSPPSDGAEHDRGERAHLEQAVGAREIARRAAISGTMPYFAGLKNVACTAIRNSTASIADRRGRTMSAGMASAIATISSTLRPDRARVRLLNDVGEVAGVAGEEQEGQDEDRARPSTCAASRARASRIGVERDDDLVDVVVERAEKLRPQEGLQSRVRERRPIGAGAMRSLRQPRTIRGQPVMNVLSGSEEREIVIPAVIAGKTPGVTFTRARSASRPKTGANAVSPRMARKQGSIGRCPADVAGGQARSSRSSSVAAARRESPRRAASHASA